jgi:hypothetical protein
MKAQSWNDLRIEIFISRLLGTGVILVASVESIGAVVYLAHHGREVSKRDQHHYAALHVYSSGDWSTDPIDFIQLRRGRTRSARKIHFVTEFCTHVSVACLPVVEPKSR